jgi:hypothetical protein
MTEKTPAPATRRISRKKKVAVATVALIGVGGAAFAYWTAGGSGDGTANAASDSSPVTIVQTSTITPIAPGEEQSLSGTIDNPNTVAAEVNGFTASISSVTGGTDGTADTDGCNPSDFTILGATVDGPIQALANDTTSWSGPSLKLLDTGVNQDACKGAVVHIHYAVN